MPNTTTTSTAAHLATILMNPITTYTKLEELTIHSYDTRLKEKWDACSMKDVVLIDLQENNLYSLNAYIKAINAIVNPNIPSKKHSIQVLACGHTYHKSCYINNRFKCMHCLSFLQDGIDEHVQSLLERLHRFEEEQQAEVEDLEKNTHVMMMMKANL
ncbi:2869_t:CDS:2 [Funneliformis caledonium]|uniref:2869_t:CDS:1 n=1 Tax=Funneliformis caledonium TaxID=1117310 RepID=A0A9N9BDT9_9GLOM|nr:2869_t:CDS:2 [Funneliformis caledonium]